MRSYKLPEINVTGIGVTSSIGQGKKDFTNALMQARHNFGVMKRPGRQAPLLDDGGRNDGTKVTSFLGAEIPMLSTPDSIPESILRTASFSSHVALATLHEAWDEAKLSDVDPYRIGLVVGGSNFQQRELTQLHEEYRDRIQFIRPTYGISFLDSDLCGLCTEIFGIRGFAYTLGSASASGQVAVVHAAQQVQAGNVDVCIAVGSLMDLSYWECLGFRSLGAMGSDCYAEQPGLACRPFDQDRDGFIFGESCGAVVIENSRSSKKRSVEQYARISGWAIGVDGNRNPNPSFEGECRVIQDALQHAGLSPGVIDYINPHGTGSRVGDETELNAINHCGLAHAYINATKSIIGHGLSAAGAVEVIATLLQIKERKLHPTRNLENPIDTSCNWVGPQSVPHAIKHALTLSIGFGGVNSALCLDSP